MAAVVVAAGILALVSVACTKPDASYVTSPSMAAIVGTAEGTVEFAPTQLAPAPTTGPDGWNVDLGNARFEELENFEPSIQVVSLLVTGEAASLDIWLTGPDGPVFHWSAGPARPYSGTLCFQFALADDGEALALDARATYTMTMALLDDEGRPIVSKEVTVAGRASGATEGRSPTGESRVARVALACPRAPL
jgi:hypothetical protein